MALRLQYVVFILLVLNSLPGAKAQAPLVDSLESRLVKLQDDTAKVNLLNDMVAQYQHTNPDRAMFLANQATALAKRINFPFGLGAAYRLTGILYVNKSSLDTGAMYYNKSFELFKNSSDARSYKFK